MNRPFFAPAMVLLAAAVLSRPVDAAGGLALPEAAPLPAPQEVVPVPEAIEEAPVERVARTALFPVGWADAVYCAGWIGAMTEPVTGRLVAAELQSSRHMFAVGDIVYSDVGARDGLMAGQEFQLLRPEHEVFAPGSYTDALGRFYATPGRLRVVCAQETTAILEIIESCEPAFIGDLLIPFEPIPIPLVRASAPLTQCDPSSGGTMGRIVEVKDRATPVGTDSVVFLDLGEEIGRYPGDFLTVYRHRNEDGSIRTLLGEVAILWTRGRTSVAKVTSTIDAMSVGDYVEVK